MSEKHAHSPRKENHLKLFNLWKWAFITLLVFLIIIFLYLFSQLRPVVINNRNNIVGTALPNSENQTIELTTNISPNDAEWLINTYLDQSAGENFSNYYVELSDQLELHGAVDFLSFNIPFSLYFSPYALEDGNIQLKGESVEVGQFSLPIQTVMSLFANQVEIPEFVAFDSEAAYINIYLDQLFSENTFDIAVNRIDLVAEDIEVDLYLTEESIQKNISIFEGTN